jgi:ankyrin repeat protein
MFLFLSPKRRILNAAMKGDLNTIQRLLEKDPSLVTAIDKNGYTSLHLASRDGNAGVVRYLLSKGANIEATTCNMSEWRPLHLAAYNGNFEVVSILVSQGADVKAKAGEFQKLTPLQWAQAGKQLIPHLHHDYVSLYQEDVVKFLQSHGG